MAPEALLGVVRRGGGPPLGEGAQGAAESALPALKVGIIPELLSLRGPPRSHLWRATAQGLRG
eukprot:8641158-Alexandrium_andersonii.AAC.1